MAVLTYSQIQDIFLDRIAANVSTDAPLSAAEIARYINDAYADVYEAEGGSIKVVQSATAWTSAQTATGVVTGILTDIKNIENIFASTTSTSTGDSTGDVELDPVDMIYLRGLKDAGGFGNYAKPQAYAVERISTSTPASVGLLRLEYWPGVTGFYLPMRYVPMFTAIDSATATTPDCSDIGSRDIALIAAIKAAPLLGRAELVPGLAADISERNAKVLSRKLRAWMQGEQETAPTGTA